MPYIMVSVLLVDDDPDSREAVARYLRNAGHRVRCVGDGRAAITSMEKDSPDVVVLDAKMPDMDGMTFLESIRCRLRWSTLPVILVTAFDEGLHIRRSMELGVRKTFLKSQFRLTDLLAHVEACTPSTTDSEMDDELPPNRGRFN
jgi:two-component system response regulator PrrA